MFATARRATGIGDCDSGASAGLRATPEGLTEPRWPRITLVTPVYNGERYLEETIHSVLDQGYPNLEYIVIDDGSTDGTAEIIKKYEVHLAWWLSQKNRGMYASLNAGYARSSGDIMGWINANDVLHRNALFVVGGVFRDLPQVKWIMGRRTILSQDGEIVHVSEPSRWSRHRFLAGANKTIQQESTFWRRSLWYDAGGYLDVSGRWGHVSDFELWVRFFRHAQIYPVDALIGAWRAHGDSGSVTHLEHWYRVQDQIVDEEIDRVEGVTPLKAMRAISRLARSIPTLERMWRSVVIQGLYVLRGPDLPPIITYQGGRWGFHV